MKTRYKPVRYPKADYPGSNMLGEYMMVGLMEGLGDLLRENFDIEVNSLANVDLESYVRIIELESQG